MVFKHNVSQQGKNMLSFLARFRSYAVPIVAPSLLFAFLNVQSVIGDTDTLEPYGDTYTDGVQPTKNYGSEPLLFVGGHGGTNPYFASAYLNFDFAFEGLSGVTVTRVRLVLTDLITSSDASFPIYLRQTTAFDESSVTDQTKPGSVQSFGSITRTSGSTTWTWDSSSLSGGGALITYVQSKINTGSNCYFLLDTPNSLDVTWPAFYSSEYSISSLRPKLIVTYTRPKVATPKCPLSSGTYSSEVANLVLLSCSTDGATIRYTMDGSEPTSSSTAYSGVSITIAGAAGSTKTLKLKAFKSGWTDSDTSTYTYNFVAPTCDITLFSSNGGTAIGGGSVSKGSSCTVTATANTGYTFANWTEGGTVVSTSASYTFTVSGARTLTANFTQNTMYSITTLSSPTAGGTTSGGGSKTSGSSCTVTATASAGTVTTPGYTFSNWTEGGAAVSSSANYTFTVSGARTLTANFTQNTMYYTVTTVPTTGGSTSGGGSKASGSSCTVTATANTGYTFANWTEGGTVVSTSASYTFTVSGARTLTANFISQPAPTITTSSPLPAGTAGTAYSTTLAASGGATPYTWSLASGSLPSGLTLIGGGTIGGTPGAAGTYSFMVRVTGGNSLSSTKEFNLTINAVLPALTIATASPLPSGTVSTAYGATLAASGGATPYTWSLASGSLPSGLSLNGGGTVGGTPGAAGTYSFTVKVTDGNGSSATQAFFLVVASAATIAPSVTPSWQTVLKDAGTTTFSVANTGSGTMAWTAAVTAGGTWARIASGASGGNAGTVTVAFDANPAGNGARSATVRVTASGAAGSPVDVTVTQMANWLSSGSSSLPDWAWGTFNGIDGMGGSGSMSVTAAGKITGKLVFGGKTYSFSAPSYTSGSESDGYGLETVAKAGSAALPVSLYVYAPGLWDDTGTLPRALGVAQISAGGEDRTFTLYRNVWKDAGMAATLVPYIGYYTATLPTSDAGSGYLAITVDKTGQAKIAGKLSDGLSVSASVPLAIEEEGRLVALIATSPSAYKGGYFTLGIELARSGTGSPFLRLYNGGERVNLNPQASASYGEGTACGISVVGGRYDKLINLSSYYADGLQVGATALPGLPVSVKYTDWGDDSRKVSWTEPGYADAAGDATPEGLALSLNAAGTGFTAPKADKPVKEDGAYYYADTNGDGANNASGLAFTFTKATGLFSGSFTAYYDYVSAADYTKEENGEKWTHAAKKISFQGVLTPVREDSSDGVEGRGFFLWADKSSYEKNAAGKTVTYGFNASYDLLLYGN